MHRTFVIAAAILALAAPALAGSYKLDAKGKCHDDHGKFAKASFCAAPGHHYKMDKKGKCRDEKGRFADMKQCMTMRPAVHN